MTIIIGLVCQDGVVVGADSSATFTSGPYRTIEQPTKKIEIIDNQIIIAGTGEVGLGQRFQDIVRNVFRQKDFQRITNPIVVAKNLSNIFLKDLSFTLKQPGSFGALVAFPCNKEYHLCEFDISSFQPEFKNMDMWYVSMGSGQPITDPFLGFLRRIFWENTPPTLKEGVFAVTWSLFNTIDLNPGGIKGPIQIAILTKNESNELVARVMEEDDLSEHRDAVKDIEIHIKGFSETLSGKNARAIPEFSN